LQVLLSEEALKRWFATNDPNLYSEFAAEPITTTVARPKPAITSDVVERAINDAESLIRSSGATSGVDRIHTALDGYLRVACDESGITYGKDPNITYLFSQLRQHHSAFQDLGPRAKDITQIVRALSSVLDVINPLRNKASMAHPNQQLLDEAEAMLVINSARTILHYIDSKLAQDKRSVRRSRF